MKKLLAILIIICLGMAVFTACDEETVTEKGTVTEKETGLLLPKTIKGSDGEFELQLTWSENKCTYEAEGITFTFTYDEATRSLNVQAGENKDVLENLCVFDENDRIIEMNFDGKKVLELDYSKEKLVAKAWGEDELDSPMSIIIDQTNRKVQMPPFDDPNKFMVFNEYGDLTGAEDRELFNYEYDEKGNILKLSSPEIENYWWDISYGEEKLTKSWQGAVLKFTARYALGNPMSIFAMDMICKSVHQNYN